MMQSERNNDSDSDNEESSVEEQQIDFCSNDDLIKRKQTSQERTDVKAASEETTIDANHRTTFERRSCPKEFKDLLQELLEDSKESADAISVIKQIQMITPVYEIITKQQEFKWNEEASKKDGSKQDFDEEKEQGESLKHVEEITSHSTDDIQESINSATINNRNSSSDSKSSKEIEQTLSATSKSKIQLDGAIKQNCSSDCGGETKYMDEALVVASSTAHSVKCQINQEKNYNNKSSLSNLSPTVTYKKKEYSHQTQKKQQVEQQSAIEEEQLPFLIIRSSKSFVPESNSVSQNKKKKKKRSKAVGPQQQISHEDQSHKLNAFIRNITNNVQEEEPLLDEKLESAVNENLKIAQKTPFTRKTEIKKPNKSSVQQVYVKKAANEINKTPSAAQVEVIDNYAVEQKINLSNPNKFTNFLKQEEEVISIKEVNSNYQGKNQFVQRQSSYGDVDEKPQLQQNPRFDQFINEKESSQCNRLRSIEVPFGGEKLKKKEVKSHKKSSNWGNSSRTGKKGASSPQEGVIKRNNYHNNSHNNKKDQNLGLTSYMSTPVTRQHSLNEGYQQMIGMTSDYMQGYDMYSQIDQNTHPYISIEQIQSFISNAAVMIQNQSYINQQPSVSNAYESENFQQQAQDTSTFDQAEMNEKTEQYFDMLEMQMQRQVKEIERKLDSVRKERQVAITRLEEIIKKTYNENRHYNQSNHKNFIGIRMYGSMASGLAIDSSDVDLAVTGLDFNGNRELHLKEMGELYHQLNFIKSKSSIKFIETAAVPVIKLYIDLQKVLEKPSKSSKKLSNSSHKTSSDPSGAQQNEIDPSMRYLGIDITFEDSSANQVVYDQTSQFSHGCNAGGGSKINLGIQCISYIQRLCMDFNDLRPIVMVLKKLLQLKDLNQPYHGGISSYSLVLMTSTFLHTCDAHSMGINLTEFLNYYGNFFDPSRTQLDGTIFSNRYAGNSIDPMVVIDPLNPVNNTTKSSFRINEIQQVFKRAHSIIILKLEESKISSESSQQFDVIKYIVEMLEEPHQM